MSIVVTFKPHSLGMLGTFVPFFEKELPAQPGVSEEKLKLIDSCPYGLWLDASGARQAEGLKTLRLPRAQIVVSRIQLGNGT